MGNETKIDKCLDKQELIAFLRDLAEAVEHGGKDEFACVDDFRKLKLSVKNEFGRFSLKARFKSAAECSAEELAEGADESGRPRYKSLKKRMRSSFRMILKLIHEGQVPPEAAMRSFLDDSALMVTYPGYGDEYYEEYTRSCEALRTAFEAGNLEAMHAAIDVIAHEKSRCHAKYD